MTLFEEIISECQLLTEITQGSEDDTIIAAIKGCRRMRIGYDDHKDKVISKSKGKRERNILPIVYGLLKNGKPAVGAFQTFGSTKRGVPKWKLFLLDNIYSNSVSKNTTFWEYKDKLIELGLNRAGDKRFSKIFAISPLCDEVPGNAEVKDSMPITDKPIQKGDIQVQQSAEQPVRQRKSSVSSSPKNQNSVDKQPQKDYTSNRLEAPDTKPITKGDIQPSIDNNTGTTTTNIAQPVDSKPITKQEVESPEVNTNKADNNELSSSFKDMMNRMNNLHKDDEEEKEEEV